MNCISIDTLPKPYTFMRIKFPVEVYLYHDMQTGHAPVKTAKLSLYSIFDLICRRELIANDFSNGLDLAT